MSDELVLSGGGSGGGVAVATDALLAVIDGCETAAREAVDGARALAVLAARLEQLSAVEAGAAGDALRLAAVQARSAAALAASAAPPADRLAWALRAAADGYGLAEAVATRAVESATEALAAVLGRVAPGLAVAASSGVIAVAAAAALLAPVLARPFGLDDELAALGTAAGAELNRFLSRPETVAAIRTAVMAADDAILGGLTGPALAALLGEDGIGATGLPFVATIAMGLAGGAGMLRETSVRLAERRSSSTAAPDPPRGWGERFERIPAPASDDGMQVLIERYTVPGEPDRFEVYIAGTVSFDPVAGTEPWDLTSNVGNASGADAASVRAVAEAMRDAGIDDTTPVQLTGFSQGAGTAARVATLDGFAVVGIAAFGGNTGQTPIPDGVRTVLVEHDDDLVPALGGRQDNDHAMLVRREAYGEVAPPAGVVLPAHQRPAYAATAALMDDADSSRMTDATAAFDAFTADAVAVERLEYRFEREDAP